MKPELFALMEAYKRMEKLLASHDMLLAAAQEVCRDNENVDALDQLRAAIAAAEEPET